MTRRKFVHVVVGGLSSMGFGLCRVLRAVSPRRVVRAARLRRYPGRIVPMADIRKQARWSG